MAENLVAYLVALSVVHLVAWLVDYLVASKAALLADLTEYLLVGRLVVLLGLRMVD